MFKALGFQFKQENDRWVAKNGNVTVSGKNIDTLISTLNQKEDYNEEDFKPSGSEKAIG